MEILRKLKSNIYLRVHLHLYLYLFLLISVLFVYGQVRNYSFISFDDCQYITDNSFVKDGLSAKNIRWAFTSLRAANWHPLTWLSHMVDVELYGLDAGHHHMTSVIIHIVNSFLLFYLINAMTGAVWRSFFVASIFALHPMHVESVVWISERKDLLCALFWFLTMISYVKYAQKSEIKRFIPVMLFFILGLMSKPMIVTLPFVLILMDMWPLGRIRYGQAIPIQNFNGITVYKSLIEKIALFLLALICVITTLIAQKNGGAVAPVSDYSLILRLYNVIVGYAKYIQMMFWPSAQSILYPRAEHVSLPAFALALMVLIFASVAAVKAYKKRAYFIVGWLWFLGTLVPVVGFVQVGMQGLADRYTYISYTGLSFIFIWFIAEWAGKVKKRQVISLIAGFLLLLAMMVKAHREVRFWENSISLYKHAISSTENNYVVYRFLGNEYMAVGMYDEAFASYNESLKINPLYLLGLNDLGNAYVNTGQYNEAINVYMKALSISPDLEKTHNNIGVVFAKQGHLDKAITHFKMALSIKKDYHDADVNLKKALDLLKE